MAHTWRIRCGFFETQLNPEYRAVQTPPPCSSDEPREERRLYARELTHRLSSRESRGGAAGHGICGPCAEQGRAMSGLPGVPAGA